MLLLRRALYIAICIAIILALPRSFTDWLRDQSNRVLAPAARTLIHQNRTIGNAWDNLRQIPTLRQDRQRLQEQVLTLQQQVAANQAVAQENETLHKELGVTGVTQTIPKILARVILQSSDRLDPTLTVDVGSDQGIQAGQPAVYQGVLIGRVDTVRKSTSVVRLITSIKSKIQAKISQNELKGLLVGTGSSVQLNVDVLQNAAIAPDSIVETSGLGGSLPQGILIGSIGSTISKPSELSQTFRINLSEEPTNLESFFILQVNAAP